MSFHNYRNTERHSKQKCYQTLEDNRSLAIESNKPITEATINEISWHGCYDELVPVIYTFIAACFQIHLGYLHNYILDT